MSKLQKVSKFFIPIILFLIASCAPREKAAPQMPESPTPQVTLPAKEGWEKEWEKTIKEGMREKRLVIFSGISPDVRMALIKSMREKFGLEVEFNVGPPGELTRRLIMERKASIYNADVGILGAGPSILELKPQGDILEPFEEILVPQLVEPEKWRIGKLDWLDKDKLALAFTTYVEGVVTINTDMVKAGELKSWRDLLEPRWKGKIIIQDPTTTGLGNNWFSVVGGVFEGFDYMRQLVKQEPLILRDVRQIAEWVGRGKYPIGIGITITVVKEMREAGFPIKDIELKGYLSAGWSVLTVFKQRPHPYASRVFANWLLSQEGQTIYSRASAYPSVRTDVPADIFESIYVPKAGIDYFRSYGEEFALKRGEYMPIAREVFSPLIR